MIKRRRTLSRQHADRGSGAFAPRDGGYSMVELMVILVIIGILLVIGIPTMLGSRGRSQDRAAQSQISSVYLVEKVVFSNRAVYTDVPATLQADEPSIAYVASKTPVATTPVYVYLAPGNIIYVGAKSATGTCFYLRDADGTGASFAKSAACDAGDTVTYGPAW